MRDIAQRATWFWWSRCVSPNRNSRAASWRTFRLRNLTYKQGAEAWSYISSYSLRERVGFTDSITPGSAENALGMLRVPAIPSYFTEASVNASRSSFRPGETVGPETPKLGYQDVIDLSFAGVPPEYAVPLHLSRTDVLDIVDLYRADVPVAYGFAAANA